MKATFTLTSPHVADRAIEAIRAIATDGSHEVVVRPKERTRNSEQNAKMWATLDEVSKQVEWHGQKLDSSEWKDIFTAALKRQKVVPGIDGGFVVIGARTSKMTIAEMSDVIELAIAFGTQHGVRWKYYE